MQKTFDSCNVYKKRHLFRIYISCYYHEAPIIQSDPVDSLPFPSS